MQEAESTVKDDRRLGPGIRSRSRSPRWRGGRQRSPPPFRARSRSPVPQPLPLKGHSRSRSPVRQRSRGGGSYGDHPMDRSYESVRPVADYSRERSAGPGPERRETLPAQRREAPQSSRRQQAAYAEDYDSLEISTGGASQPTRKFDQTGTTLHERFTFDDSPANFVPKENISVGIERNIPGNEQAVVGGTLFPDQVSITRRRGEGEVPLHKREEFLGPQDDDHSERRVIRVAKGMDDVMITGLGDRDNFEVRRGEISGARGPQDNRWEDRRRGRREDTRSFERYWKTGGHGLQEI